MIRRERPGASLPSVDSCGVPLMPRGPLLFDACSQKRRHPRTCRRVRESSATSESILASTGRRWGGVSGYRIGSPLPPEQRRLTSRLFEVCLLNSCLSASDLAALVANRSTSPLEHRKVTVSHLPVA